MSYDVIKTTNDYMQIKWVEGGIQLNAKSLPS